MPSFSIIVAADLANGIGLNGGLPWRLRKDMAFFARLSSKVISQQPQHFNACIMGRRTWESIPAKFRPLVSRFNIIISRNPRYLDDKPEKTNPLVALAPSLDAALDLVQSLQKPSLSQTATTLSSTTPSPALGLAEAATVTPSSPIRIERAFLIGGAQLYNEGVQSKDCSHIFLTRVQTTVECDTFFPEIKPTEFELLPSPESHAFLENFLQEPVQGGMIEEGNLKYEYTVYSRI